MVRPVEQKKRRRGNRQRNKIILIGTEGNNKTETLYFNGIKQHITGYRIFFARGNDTDPVKIVQNTSKSAGKNHMDLDFKHGDLAFSVFDTDTDTAKQPSIEGAIEFGKKHNIEVILSNPCFEVWYLLHFRYSAKQYDSSKDVVAELKKCIPSYEKSNDVFDQLWPKVDDAIHRCDLLNEYHLKCKRKLRSLESNPSTEMANFIRKICKPETYTHNAK